MKSFDLVYHFRKKYKDAVQTLGTKKERYRQRLKKYGDFIKKVKIAPATFVVTSFLLITLVLGLNNYFNSFFHVVYFEKENIGLTKDVAEVEKLISGMLEEKNQRYDFEVFPVEEITFSEIELHWLGREDFEEIEKTIAERLTFYAGGYMVYVDDKPTICLESKEKFDEILEALKQRYVPEHPHVKMLSITTAEKISGERIKVAPDEVMDTVEAFRVLYPETAESRVYLASRGESLHAIAEMHNMGVKALEERNPGLDDVELEEGQEIYMPPKPVITIVSVEELTVQESIPYEIGYVNNAQMEVGQSRVKTAGKEGILEITYHVTRENGKETDRQKNGEKVVQEPRNEIVERGTRLKEAAKGDSQPTGKLIWPVPGSYDGGGRITNSYSAGHRGIDIYASTLNKTPIVAADSGTVVAAQYYKAYGNIVVINHGKLCTLYGHLSQILVAPGQSVSRGGTIGYMGNTGQTYGRTGIHLHFEVRVANGGNWNQCTRVNPLDYVNR